MITGIISGGQTGVDQAALEVATELGIPTGGWCPKGGLDENSKPIPKKYHLQETESAKPDIRTVLNILDSDGTLILVPKLPLPDNIKDGTNLTIDTVKKRDKHFLIIDLSSAQNTTAKIIKWIADNNIKILNIAGPRESNSKGIYDLACKLFRDCFPAIAEQKSKLSTATTLRLQSKL